MSTTTENSDDLVKDVLAAMRRGAAGDASAIDALKKASSKDGLAEDAAKPAPPAATALVAKDLEIKRPNGEIYHVRKLGEHHDVEVLRRARAKRIHPLLTGLPGTGKTALLEAAYCTDSRVYTIQGSGDTEWADFIGSHVQRVEIGDDGKPIVKYPWVDGPLPRAMDEGAVLYVDEIALIDPKVLAGLYAVIDGRNVLHITQNPERGDIVPKDGFFVVAACNPNAPGARMSEALLSRFTLQFEVTTDYTLARKFGVDARMITAAMNMQKKLDSGSGLGWAPQLRELMAFVENSREFGEDVALSNMVMQAPEMDRSVVADLISRSYHKQYKGLKLA